MWADMWVVEEEIARAISSLGLASEMRLCDAQEAAEVIRRVEQTFVAGSPRVWWLALLKKAKATPTPEVYDSRFVESLVPGHETSCWFVPEGDSGRSLVFDTSVRAVAQIVDETYGFEYNLIGKKFDWFLAETEHNEVLVIDARGLGA